MSPNSRFLFLISPLLLLLTNPAISQTCWYPDGLSQAQADVPCDPNAETSACCGPNAFCLSNGLCYVSGAVSRGSCTDKNWGPGCAGPCSDVNIDGGVILQSCDPSQNTFACGLFNESCQNERSFPLTGANTIVLRPDQVENGSVQQRRINPTSTLTATSHTGGFSTAEMAGVGVGVGVPLLAALAAATFILLKQRREIKILQSEPKSTKEESSFGSPAYAHSMPLQAPNAAYGNFEYQPLATTRPQGHFQEVVVNELDGTSEPRELAGVATKPRSQF